MLRIASELYVALSSSALYLGSSTDRCCGHEGHRVLAYRSVAWCAELPVLSGVLRTSPGQTVTPFAANASTICCSRSWSNVGHVVAGAASAIPCPTANAQIRATVAHSFFIEAPVWPVPPSEGVLATVS